MSQWSHKEWNSDVCPALDGWQPSGALRPVIETMFSTTARDSSTFKLVFVGDSGVGKTSLVERTVKNSFTEFADSTIGAAFHKYTLKTDDNRTVTYNIWDTAGQERYRSLGPIYYR